MSVVQDMIQRMFGFLPNGEPQSSQPRTVSDDQEPHYDTPHRAPQPVVKADNQPVPSPSPASISMSSVQPSSKPKPVPRVRSSKQTYVYVFAFTFIVMGFLLDDGKGMEPMKTPTETELC